MRPISTEGFEKPKFVSAGARPILEWLRIADLVVGGITERPIVGKARRRVNRIANGFSWSCFAPVVVAPVAEGRFIIIDGLHRTTAAALVGFDCVPCQIVQANEDERLAAFNSLNRSTGPHSQMALHAAAVGAGDDFASHLANLCARAEVELLQYPVPVERQSAGQTMAVGAVARCLKRYGEETLITALQCVTQTANNRPGALSARMIKALCAALDGNAARRDSGLALLEAFDAIDLPALERAAAASAATEKITPVEALAKRVRSELDRLLPCRDGLKVSDFGSHVSPIGNRTATEFPCGPTVEVTRPPQVNEVLQEIARRKNDRTKVFLDLADSKSHAKPVGRLR